MQADSLVTINECDPSSNCFRHYISFLRESIKYHVLEVQKHLKILYGVLVNPLFKKKKKKTRERKREKSKKKKKFHIGAILDSHR